MKLLLLILPALLSASVPDCQMQTKLALWYSEKAIEQPVVNCKQLTIALAKLSIVDSTCHYMDVSQLRDTLQLLHTRDCK